MAMTRLADLDTRVSIKQLCDALGISRPTAYSMIERGEVHAIKVRNQYRISRRSIDEFVNRQSCVRG